MTDTWQAIVITDGIKTEAKALLEALSSRASGMFETPLSATGTAPATHWVSAGHVDAGLVQCLADPSILKAACDARGYPITLAQCEALLAEVQSSDGTCTAEIEGETVTYDEDAHGFLARMELRLIVVDAG